MTQFTRNLMLAGVAVLSLTACGGDGKGPGALGSKNDIVVKNNGLPNAQKQAGDTQISSTTEQVAPMPPAEVAAGEVLPAAGEQTATTEPLPSTDPAVVAAAQKVEEAKAPVASTTTTPVADGTTASTAPATETVPADVVAPETIQDQEVTPPQLEGTATAEEKTAVTGATPAATPAYPKAAETPVAPPATAVPAETPAPAVTAPVTPAASATVVAKPTGTHDTAYSIPAPAGASASAAAATTTTTPVAASGTLNPYDPALIKAAQSALATKAGYTGAANGELSSEFLNALSKYQSENKLTPGGVNVETLRSLGVIE